MTNFTVSEPRVEITTHCDLSLENVPITHYCYASCTLAMAALLAVLLTWLLSVHMKDTEVFFIYS